MEGQVPGGKPGIFPFIGHGENIGHIGMMPGGVPLVITPFEIKRHFRVPFQPLVNIAIIELLAP
ncbi:hypothetical protein D9M70_625380 [compost metagenome]